MCIYIYIFMIVIYIYLNIYLYNVCYGDNKSYRGKGMTPNQAFQVVQEQCFLRERVTPFTLQTFLPAQNVT